ncbi:hypothetical protein M430DRAFT_199153 [Amorphotheca resinae ATCC 22711]|uniref:Uncharacterized protein n=1 Tax=Amorphotheca resinae ATCC 22711 TaxID=857342 RepID=A0A2T3BA23_AMORE|nr:hypothetical protein M430DRAFT_199153 [Amorphotheca resinae ATCC 22711]PSS25173.1 hypothetical protein M430DRAFT_199153 [Amorphotheca resinae ATCC 22711]
MSTVLCPRSAHHYCSLPTVCPLFSARISTPFWADGTPPASATYSHGPNCQRVPGKAKIQHTSSSMSNSFSGFFARRRRRPIRARESCTFLPISLPVASSRWGPGGEAHRALAGSSPGPLTSAGFLPPRPARPFARTERVDSCGPFCPSLPHPTHHRPTPYTVPCTCDSAVQNTIVDCNRAM